MDNAILVDIQQYNRVIYSFINSKKLDVISNNGLQIIFEYKAKSKYLDHSRHVKNSKGIKVPDSKLPKDTIHGIIRIVMISDTIAYIDHTTSKLKDVKSYLTKNRVQFIDAKSCQNETDLEIRKRVLTAFIKAEISNDNEIIKEYPTDQLVQYDTIEPIGKYNLTTVIDRGDRWYPDYIGKDNNYYLFEPSSFDDINKLSYKLIIAINAVANDNDKLFKLKYDCYIDRAATIIVNVRNCHRDLKVELILLLIKYYGDRFCVDLKVIT